MNFYEDKAKQQLQWLWCVTISLKLYFGISACYFILPGCHRAYVSEDEVINIGQVTK